MINHFTNDMNKEILIHLSNGLTVKEIACKVFMTKRSVERRTRKMKNEAGVKNNVELIKYAIEKQLLNDVN